MKVSWCNATNRMLTRNSYKMKQTTLKVVIGIVNHMFLSITLLEEVKSLIEANKFQIHRLKFLRIGKELLCLKNKKN